MAGNQILCLWFLVTPYVFPQKGKVKLPCGHARKPGEGNRKRKEEEKTEKRK